MIYRHSVRREYDQIIKLYTLNIYNFICQLYLNKAEKKSMKNNSELLIEEDTV